MISITELKAATRGALKDINRLLPQLSSSARKLSYPALKRLVRNMDTHLLVLRDGKKIVGMGTLITMGTVLGPRARLEDIVVDQDYRGKGFGERLTKKLIARAREKRVEIIELSSRSSRIAANKLYQKLGFREHETNVYKMKL